MVRTQAKTIHTKISPDLNHSPTAGDQWGGDNTRHAVISQLEIRSTMLCWNNVQVESGVGNVCYQAK